MENLSVKQLRIGNYVMVDNQYRPDDKGALFEVIKVDQNGKNPLVGLKTTSNFYDDFSQVERYIQPIPLTEEWLEKFGFEKDSTGWYSKNDLGLKKNGDHFEDYYYFRKLKHVHNLQNFYKECKGEELTLKKDD